MSEQDTRAIAREEAVRIVRRALEPVAHLFFDPSNPENAIVTLREPWASMFGTAEKVRVYAAPVIADGARAEAEKPDADATWTLESAGDAIVVRFGADDNCVHWYEYRNGTREMRALLNGAREARIEVRVVERKP